MAKIAFRMLVTAALGALLGAAFWLERGLWSGLLAGPVDLGERPLVPYLLGGAGVGALLALALDLSGLDLPLFASMRRSPQQAKRVEPIGLSPSLGERVREWSSGTHPGWIEPRRVEHVQAQLRHVQRRSGLLLGGMLSTLAGMGLSILYAGSAGALGSPGAGLPLFAIALVCYAILFAIGSTLWRVLACGFALATVAAAVLFLS